MPGASVIPRGAGEVLRDAPGRRLELLSEAPALHATWTRMAAGTEGADPHVHRGHTDLFYVLDGELTVRVGSAGEPVAAPAGTLARIPPLVVHGYRNASDRDVRFLNLHVPGSGFAAYLRALRDGRPHTFDQEPPPLDGGRSAALASVAGGAGALERDGRRVAVLADEDAVSIAEVTVEPSASPAAPQVQRCHVEAAYVLAGDLEVLLDGSRLRAGAGAWVTVPPGVPHAFCATAPARYLRVRAPVSA